MRKIIYAIIFSGITMISCYGQSTKSLKKSGKVFLPLQATEISIIIERGLYFATNVSINNTPIAGRFLIDTGSQTTISDSLAQELEIKTIYEDKIVTDGFAIDSNDVGLADITINGILFENIGVNIDDSDLGLGVFCNVKGIIGNNLMRHCSWHFSQDRVEIIPNVKKYKGIDKFIKDKLILMGGYYPTIYTKFGKPIGTTLFDTGDNGFMEIDQTTLSYVPNTIIKSGKGISEIRAIVKESITQSSSKKVAVKTKSMKIGSQEIKNPIAHIGGERTGWSIGSEFFNYFETILDFPHKKIYLKQLRSEYQDTRWNNFGFNPFVNGQEVIIGFVWDNSPAQEEGINPGNKIIRINELEVDEIINFSECEINSLIYYELSKNSISITIQDEKGNYNNLNLFKKGLFE